MIKRNPRIIKRNIELWKPIKGFPDYEISNMGRVKSLDRFVKYPDDTKRLQKERILKPGKSSPGYLIVGLYLKKKMKVKPIHLLVITHFGPPKPTPKHECNHKDGIKINNWWTNLEWMTSKQNAQHALDTGLFIPARGEKHWIVKLTEKEVKKIRRLYETDKYSMRELGKLFGVSYGTINPIIHHKTWKHI